MRSEERPHRIAAPEDDHQSPSFLYHKDWEQDLQKVPTLRVKLEKAHVLYGLHTNIETAIVIESSIEYMVNNKVS